MENDKDEAEKRDKSHNYDICKLLIYEVCLTCNLCNKYYHSVYAHPFSSVIEQTAGQAYVCFNCIHNKKASFYCLFLGKHFMQ